MKRIILLSILSIMMSCMTSPKISRDDAIEIDPVKKSIFEEVFNTMKSDGFTGTILIAERGEIVYTNSYGYTNLTDSIDINENTMFELASVTKQFTAAGIALLEQQGKIDTELPVSTYFPELTKYRNVSVKNLIHHTSGLPEYDEDDWIYDRSQFITNDSLINYLSRVNPPLLFEPGTQYSYCNTGYVILASLIERLTNSTFNSYLTENIFNEAEMSRTKIYRPRYSPEQINNYAIGYVYSDSLQRNTIPDKHEDHNYVVHLDGIQGDGMVNSTVMDLLKWDRFLYSNKIFSDETKQKMFGFSELKDGSEINYGYGWRLEKDELYGKVAKHSGGWPGYVTFIERYLDSDKTIIVLQNNYNNFNLNTKLMRVILHNELIPKIDKNNFIGKYEFEDDNTVLEVKAQGNKLIGVYDGDSFNLIQLKSNVFFIENQQSVEIEFIEELESKISQVKWHQGDYIGNLKRIK